MTGPTTCTVNVACGPFTDASTDDAGITARSWDFTGDNTEDYNTATVNHAFPAAGVASVRLIVTDAEGLADTTSQAVTVAPATPGNTAPTANFEVTSNPCTAGTPCGFNDLSTDPDVGATLTGSWDFGDGNTAVPGLDITHTFDEPGSYNVTLTVTDNAGASNAITLPVDVAPIVVGQDCTTTSNPGSNPVVDCELTVNIQSTVTFTVESEECDFTGNRLEITAPMNQVIFFNLCNQTPGATHTVSVGGVPVVFPAGTVLNVHFVRGAPGPTDPPASDPGIQVDGTSPSWQLNIDDGGLAGTEGEPDFDDAVVDVVATASP
jgi:PKD repeat protein